jgi:AcrR family transcriptional regulator
MEFLRMENHKPTHDTAETRERIVQAAVNLFAENGYAATSVRDITAEAGTNVAAVNYHFQGKENLYLETFRSLLEEMRDLRIVAMRRDMNENPEMGLEGFIESFANAFIEPLVTDESRGRLLLGFFAHEMVEPHLPSGVFGKEFIHPLVEVSLEALGRLGPPMATSSQHLCLMSLVGQLIHAVKARHLFAGDDHPVPISLDLQEHIRHIVRFSVGGIRACAQGNATQSVRVLSQEAKS